MPRFRFRPVRLVLQPVCLHPYSAAQKCQFITFRLCRINQFRNHRLTIDDFTAYPQVNVFTTTCGSLSESKPEPQHITRHIILSLGHKVFSLFSLTCTGKVNVSSGTSFADGPGDSISKAIGYGLDGPGVQEVEIFLHSFVSTLVLGSTQQGISLGVKAAECRTSHPTSPQYRGCEYMNPCIYIPRGRSWPVMGIHLRFYFLCRQRRIRGCTIGQTCIAPDRRPLLARDSLYI